MTNAIMGPWSVVCGRAAGVAAAARYHCTVEGEEAGQDAADRDYATAMVATTVPEVVRWVELVLEHPDTTVVRLDTGGPRERRDFVTIGTRTRHRILEVVRHALGRGGAVTVEVVISSLIHRLRLTVLVGYEPRRAEERAGSTRVQGTDAP